MEKRRAFIILMAWMIGVMTASGEYILKMRGGKYPEGVKTENLNNNIPQQLFYKNGWTDQGWTVGDYATSSNVALSPSYLLNEGTCENALTLPPITIEEGEWLSWDGCEVYPVFSDTYTVEFRPSGDDTWINLGDYTETKSLWSHHMIDLAPYKNTEGEIRFVCRSTDGYMLALNKISINRPTEYSFISTNNTPKFFAIKDLADDKALTEITVTNTGVALPNAILSITVGESMASSLQEDEYWNTGETRTFQLPLPLTLNERCDYTITIETPDGEKRNLAKSFAYCTSFRRYLYVDKGTGMWCNACPNGTLAIEQLEQTYGDALIVGETHNKDLLANEIDFTWLTFYSIPHLMLNHIKSTKGENASKFEDHICVPTEMEIEITDLTIKNNGTMSVSASVRTSESFADTDKKYRIGYMLTRNVSGNEDVQYYQKNICTTATQKQYRYLPSTIPSMLCYFPNVSIPSQLATTSENPAFTGIEGSLPDNLTSGATYKSELDIPFPEGFDNIDGIRIVAFIIDADRRVIINSTAQYTDDLTGIEEITDSLNEAAERIFTIDGRPIRAEKNSLLPGLYIINGKKVLIK